MWESEEGQVDRQMNSQSTDSCTFQSASGGWTEVWRKRCREKHHEWKAGWRKRVKLGPPFQVLWCQCSCYQPRRLPLGAPAWQTTITRVKHTLEVTSLAAGIISALFWWLVIKAKGCLSLSGSFLHSMKDITAAWEEEGLTEGWREYHLIQP